MSTHNIHYLSQALGESGSDNSHRKCRRTARIIKHLKNQISSAGYDESQLPSDWLIQQLVNNAFCYVDYNPQHDWHETIYHTLQSIVNNLHQFYIYDATTSINDFCALPSFSSKKGNKLFTNDENLSPYQVNAFALRLLTLIDHKESQFKPS